MCPSVHLPTYPSIYLFIYLPVCLNTSISISSDTACRISTVYIPQLLSPQDSILRDSFTYTVQTYLPNVRLKIIHESHFVHSNSRIINHFLAEYLKAFYISELSGPPSYTMSDKKRLFIRFFLCTSGILRDVWWWVLPPTGFYLLVLVPI